MSQVVKMYCAGGCAANIAKKLEAYRGKESNGFASLDCVYIDTSRSNHDSIIPEDRIYHINHDNTDKNVDGSGKKRDTNAALIQDRVKEILLQFKPTEFNIVLHSASGGSGSVIAPTLVSEMLDNDIPVIVIIVGSRDSRIEVNNTINTMKSYESIARMRDKPVIAAYYENNTDNSRAATDSDVQNMIAILSVILSKENKELDSSDLKNWLDYTRVTSFPPRLSFLTLFNKEVVMRKGETIISVCTLVDKNASASLELPVEYQTVGFVDETNLERLNLTYPTHSAIIGGAFNGLINSLTKRLEEYDAVRKSINDRQILVGGEKATSSGLIL